MIILRLATAHVLLSKSAAEVYSEERLFREKFQSTSFTSVHTTEDFSNTNKRKALILTE